MKYAYIIWEDKEPSGGPSSALLKTDFIHQFDWF